MPTHHLHKGRDRIHSQRLWLGVIVGVFLALCTVLRAPINVIPPLVGQIAQHTGLSQVSLGALTSLPVLCYGMATPLASMALRRIGANTGGLVTLVLILAGALLRGCGPVWAIFAGTVVMGVGITVGNLVAPMVIGRDFWHKAATMTGLYSATCNVWVTVVTALAVPLAGVVGWGASATLWAAVPTTVALAVWVWVYPPGLGRPRGTLLRRSSMVHWTSRAPESTVTEAAHLGSGKSIGVEQPVEAGRHRRAVSRGRGRRPVWRRPQVWLMAVTFACHTFSYYALLAWLPTLLSHVNGMGQAQAGVASSVFSLAGIAGPLVVPVMCDTLHWSERQVIGLVSVCWLALPVCLVIAPSAWLVPCVVSGIAQGAFFAALFTIVIRRAQNMDDNREMTALIQTTGYLVAALGPVVVGALQARTGSWVMPVALIIAVLVVMTGSGYSVASRERGDAHES